MGAFGDPVGPGCQLRKRPTARSLCGTEDRPTVGHAIADWIWSSPLRR